MVELKDLFFIYDDSKECNMYKLCVSAVDPEIRVFWQWWLLPPCGFFWILAYIIYIYYGFKNRVCYMPYLALYFNISWEFLFSFVYTDSVGPVQLIVNYLWFAFDLLLVFQFVLYGTRDLPINVRQAGRTARIIYCILVFFPAFLMIQISSLQIENMSGEAVAFWQNAAMSFLFLLDLLNRNDTSTIGYIEITTGICRLIGTPLTVAIWFHIIIADSILMDFFFVFIFFADLSYVLVAWHYARKPKRKKKKRF